VQAVRERVERTERTEKTEKAEKDGLPRSANRTPDRSLVIPGMRKLFTTVSPTHILSAFSVLSAQ
jgi:hypothetical protein